MSVKAVVYYGSNVKEGMKFRLIYYYYYYYYYSHVWDINPGDVIVMSAVISAQASDKIIAESRCDKL